MARTKPTLSRRTALLAGAGLVAGSVLPSAMLSTQRAQAQSDTLNRAHNHRFAKVPGTHLMPTTAGQVRDGVISAIAQREPFTIQSSGHCFAGLSQTSGTLIDLRNLNTISINEADQTLTAGPGATIGQVNAATRPSGLALPAGYCQTVALGGHASGGGAGVLGRSYGLACDNIVAAQIVTADGTLLTVDANNHPDLYWALRGGGAASFGVVVANTFALHRPGPVTLLSASGRPSVEQAAVWLTAWQDVAAQASRAVSFNIYLSNVDGVRVGLRARLVANGAGDEARAALAAINARAGFTLPTHTDETDAFHGIANRMWSPDFYGGGSYQIRSDFLGTAVSAQGWFQTLRAMADNRRYGLSFSLEALGGAMDDLVPTDTAFVHRRVAKHLVQYQAVINPDLPVAPRLEALARMQGTLHQFTTGGAFLNYPEVDRPNWQQAYWGENFDRLQQVKRTYDPGNIFRHALSVEP